MIYRRDTENAENTIVNLIGETRGLISITQDYLSPECFPRIFLNHNLKKALGNIRCQSLPQDAGGLTLRSSIVFHLIFL